MTEPCEHLAFEAALNVHRLASKEGGPIDHFAIELQLSCVACKAKLAFPSLDAGLSFYKPTCDVEGVEARLPAVVQGQTMPSGLPGFNVVKKAMLF